MWMMIAQVGLVVFAFVGWIIAEYRLESIMNKQEDEYNRGYTRGKSDYMKQLERERREF